MSQRAGMIVAGVFVLGVATLVGCGSKPQPEKPEEPAKTDQQPPDPPSYTPNVSPVKLVHELDPSKHVLPAGMVLGTVGDVAFAPQALIEGDFLVFRTLKSGTTQTDREIKLKLGSVSDPKTFDNRKATIRQEMPVGPEVPEVWVKGPNDDHHSFLNGYALTLELGSRQNWQILGKIYLCLPDKDKTVLAGGFIASFPRQVTEPPGPDDLPYIKGSINVIGAAEGTRLRVGYVGTPNEKTFPMGLAEELLGEPVEPIRWTRSDFDRPHVITLIAGDGKNVPSRYEFSKLTPGKYLAFATLQPSNPGEQPGPVASKWLTVKPMEAMPVDLTVDATQSGGVEIDIPENSIETVQLVPFDKSSIQPLDPVVFAAYALQLGLERQVVAHKTIFKKLSPGLYDLRAGVHRSTIEIVAGKTIELNFDKKTPIPAKVEKAPETPPKP